MLNLSFEPSEIKALQVQRGDVVLERMNRATANAPGITEATRELFLDP